MSSTATDLPAKKKHTPYVPETMEMKEFTFRALLIGLVMTAILGSANAYLGLKAGMTIAATYPAAVIGMALLRLMKGSLLEENIARTVGSIGESVAAGAVFTIPAFVMAGLVAGPHRRQILASCCADGDRRHARHSVRHTLTARHGGRSGTALSGVGGGFRDSQGGPAGRKSSQDSVRQHGLWRIHVPAGRRQRVFREQYVSCQHQRAGKKAAAAHQHQSECRHHGDRRRDYLYCSGHQPRLPRRGIHHWTSAGGVELCRRRAGLGTAGSAPHLYDWPVPAGRATSGPDNRVELTGGGYLLLDCASDRGGRNAGGRDLHAFQDAQATRQSGWGAQFPI